MSAFMFEHAALKEELLEESVKCASSQSVR